MAIPVTISMVKKISRRSVLRYFSAIPLAMAGLSYYSFKFEPEWIEYVRLNMSLPRLPEQWKGRTIVQISDIHIGHRVSWHYVKAAFEKVTALQPDLVVYTGDYITYKDAHQLEELREAAIHFPKGKLGTLASLGNHDYGIGWSQPEVADIVTDILEKQGITVLVDKSYDVDGLTVTGLDDYLSSSWNTKRAQTVLQLDQPQLVLCHNPDVCDLPIWDLFSGYILAGHTHGGQVKPPFFPPPMLPVKNRAYTQGLIAVGPSRHLYINRAIGCLWPVRFNVRPEVTIFTVAHI